MSRAWVLGLLLMACGSGSVESSPTDVLGTWDLHRTWVNDEGDCAEIGEDDHTFEVTGITDFQDFAGRATVTSDTDEGTLTGSFLIGDEGVSLIVTVETAAMAPEVYVKETTFAATDPGYGVVSSVNSGGTLTARLDGQACTESFTLEGSHVR